LTAAERWLADFDHHLDQVAGNAQRTRSNYLRYARRFLTECFGIEAPNWSVLQPEQVTEFVRSEASKLQISSCGQPVTAIRALLRFLVSRGVIPQGLERAVPPVLTWRHSSLPRHITSSEVERVIGACNAATPLGLRERAAIMLLAHLGLRAGEVIRLKLDDIDWFEGRLRVGCYVSLRRALGYVVYDAVWQTFIGLAHRAGIRNDDDASRPCIHGLRHSFAVGRLLDWYRRGLSVNDLLPTLSVYMGHVQPANTYWYLTATPELLNAAGEYFQKFAGQGVEQ
jgi:integrase